MNIQKLMKQAQQMQSKMAEAQEKLKEITVEASAGGEMVTVTANAAGDILAIKIKPEVVDPEDTELLEDMILGAVTEAQRLARTRQEKEMSDLTGGMGLPPGMLR